MRRQPIRHTPLEVGTIELRTPELGSLDPRDLVLTRRAVDGTVTSRVRWAARASSHAVTCDYLMGRGRRVCSCGASQVAVR